MARYATVVTVPLKAVQVSSEQLTPIQRVPIIRSAVLLIFATVWLTTQVKKSPGSVSGLYYC